MLYVDAGNRPALKLYIDLGFDIDHIDRAYVGDVAPTGAGAEAAAAAGAEAAAGAGAGAPAGAGAEAPAGAGAEAPAGAGAGAPAAARIEGREGEAAS
jgi:hypothetical protein